MAYAAVISLQNTIVNFKDSRSFLLLPHSVEIIKTAYDQLEILKGVLKRLDASSKGRSRKKVNALDAEIKEVVWEFEDVVESHVYPQILGRSFMALVNLRELRNDIDSFTTMLKEEEEEYVSELDHLLREEKDEPPSDTDQHQKVDRLLLHGADSGVKKPKMVGSSDPLLRKIRWKLGFSSPVGVVSVVGMAGIGKTTIAREVFDDPLLFTELEFECRAWVTVGRKRELRRIKRDILTQLDPSMDRKIGEEGERNVGHYLNRVLTAKRCFVVLDDVWDSDAWEELKSCFPDHGRARNLFLLTTRLRHVADEADRNLTRARYEVELLNKDESWDLLRQRVLFEEEEEEEGECPREFIKSGKKIAEKCDGLPLMIVAVAALLSEAEMTAEFWEEVAEKANHPIFTAAYDQLYEVLIPSYEYLPQHLKPCFLQMGVFPQNYESRRTKLFSMWIAEGFLDLEPDRRIEDHLQVYLTELVNHSVAIICQRNSSFAYDDHDDMKTCRLHSTFWHLCRKEATTTKFCRVLTNRDDAFQQLTIKGQRRLSFHNNILFAMKDVVDSVEEACASSARALLCYGPYHPYPVPISFELRLLKLLDALRIRFYEFPEQVMQLVYLKYFALTCNSVLPSSISRLLNLRFLIVHRNESIRFFGQPSYVPVEVWKMRELQRIEIEGRNLPNPNDGPWLNKLLKLVGVGAETCTRDVLERIPNLKKLGIQIELSPGAHEMEQVLDHLSNIYLLRELTSLKCVVVNPTLTRNGITAPLSTFPSGLKKLYLCGLGLPWEHMSVIGSLRNLEVLKLQCYAFQGPEWVVRSGEFRALKSLVINGTDLVHLKVEARAFLSLQMLGFVDCYKLKRLRWELNDLCQPLQIIMIDCGTSAVTCAEELASSSYSYTQGRLTVFARSSWLDGKSK